MKYFPPQHAMEEALQLVMASVLYVTGNYFKTMERDKTTDTSLSPVGSIGGGAGRSGLWGWFP